LPRRAIDRTLARTMPGPSTDILLRHARREALFAFGAWLAAMSNTREGPRSHGAGGGGGDGRGALSRCIGPFCILHSDLRERSLGLMFAARQ
jgi:hypothetical protein